MLEGDLAKFVREEISARADPFQLLVVESVQYDGTVNLKWGADVLAGIPCNQSYVNRKDGDVVLVIRHSGGWRVIDKIGAEHTIDFPVFPELSFGTAQPSGGEWVKGEAIWVKNGAIYIQTGVGPALPGGGGSTQSASSPRPVTIEPTATAGYRSGLRVGAVPKQGVESAYTEPWAGAWFYGDTIATACTGKEVTSMAIELVRSKTPHGTTKKTPAYLGTHNHQNPPDTTPEITNAWTGPGLGLGEAAFATVPDETAQALAAGDIVGIAATSDIEGNYIEFDTCGNLLITFV